MTRHHGDVHACGNEVATNKVKADSVTMFIRTGFSSADCVPAPGSPAPPLPASGGKHLSTLRLGEALRQGQD